ncbi:MAG: protein kinase [Polyangiaceae bacterium]
MALRAEAMLGSIRLVAPLGAGGMGSVWRAEDSSLGRAVAVKVIGTAAPDETAIARFKREATLAARIASPHVVQIYAHALTDEGLPYIVMELLRGESLAERLGRGRLDRAEIGEIVRQVARALSAAHELDVVHRDIKPANVFLVKDASYGVFVKVLDFGIAKDTEALGDDLTGTGAAVGTPSYMSPEQLTTVRGVDRRADLWALGVMTYEMLTGRLPFVAETVGALAVAVSRGDFVRPSERLEDGETAFDAWCARALRVEREARFASANEMSEAFQAALAAQGKGPARPPPPIDAHAPTEEFLLAQRATEGGESERIEPPGESGGREAHGAPMQARSAPARAGRRPSWVVGVAAVGVAAAGLTAYALSSGPAGTAASAQSGAPSASVPGRTPTTSAPLTAPPSASAASSPTSAPRYLCPDQVEKAHACGKLADAWCDATDAFIGCCGHGLAAVGHDGLCACGVGGTKVKAALDAGCGPPPAGPTATQAMSEFLDGARPELVACFDAARAKNPRAHGVLAIEFAADPDGHVFRARLIRTTHPDPEAQACALTILRRFQRIPPRLVEETTAFGIEMDL